MSIQPFARRDFSATALDTTLTADLAAGGLSFTLSDPTGFPDGGPGYFLVVLAPDKSTEEKILCQSRSGSTVLVPLGGRGFEGTTAQDHLAGSTIVRHCIGKIDVDEANLAVANTIFLLTAKGQILAASAPNTAVAVDAGPNGYAVIYDSTKAGGLAAGLPLPSVHDHSTNGFGGNIPQASIVGLATALAAQLGLAGGTMTGLLLLSADPVAALGAVTKQYADAIATAAANALTSAITTEQGARAAADNLRLLLAGGTLTGPLILAADPAVALGAASKQYVDNAKIAGGWTAFTPVLHGSTGGGAFGNATNNNSKYRLITHTAGKTLDVFVDFTILAGTTTSFGTGSLLIDLPAGLAAPAATPAHVGDGAAISGATRLLLGVEMVSTTQFQLLDTNGVIVAGPGGASPFSWSAAGANLRCRLTLEVS